MLTLVNSPHPYTQSPLNFIGFIGKRGPSPSINSFPGSIFPGSWKTRLVWEAMDMVLEYKQKKVLIPAWIYQTVLANWLGQGLYGKIFLYVEK